MCINPTYKHEKLGPKAIRYQSKGYVMYREHTNGGITENNSHNVDFLKDDFPSIGEIKKDLKLYELHQDLQPLFGKG